MTSGSFFVTILLEQESPLHQVRSYGQCLRDGREQEKLSGVLRERLTMYKRLECSEVFTKPESTAHRNHLGFLGRVRKGVSMALGTLPGRWPGRWPERTENFDHSSSADSLGQTAELKPSLESGFFFFLI